MDLIFDLETRGPSEVFLSDCCHLLQLEMM